MFVRVVNLSPVKKTASDYDHNKLHVTDGKSGVFFFTKENVCYYIEAGSLPRLASTKEIENLVPAAAGTKFEVEQHGIY